MVLYPQLQFDGIDLEKFRSKYYTVRDIINTYLHYKNTH